MIKAILFDIGGVILDMKAFNAKLIEILQPPDKKKFWEKINIETIPLCRGDITFHQFWKNMSGNLHVRSSERALKEPWFKHFRELVVVDKGVQGIISQLRKHYKLGIVSNSIPEHTKLNRAMGVFTSFDVVVLSYRLRLTKDEKKIFLLAAKGLGVMSSECVFIDDISEFADVAASAGMKAIVFRNSRQLRADLRNLGVEV